MSRGKTSPSNTDGRAASWDQLPALAAELVSRQVDVIAATGGVVTAHAAIAATSSIPIVFNSGEDPIQAGLVTSLNRPGGNVTGVSWFNVDGSAKRLALLHELVPAAPMMALLGNPKTEFEPAVAVAKDAARNAWAAVRRAQRHHA